MALRANGHPKPINAQLFMSLKQNLIKSWQDPRRAIKVIGNKLFSILGHRDYIPFIILSRSRTGSNLLVSFLNSHPNVFSDAELFNIPRPESYQRTLKRTFGKQPRYCKARGFKIFYYHPRDKNAIGVWDALAAMDNLHVIHLKRENILHTLVSRRIAGIRSSWVARSDSRQAQDQQQKIELDFTHESLREGFEKTRRDEREGDERFRNHPMISISYEELTNDAEATFARITDFLGVERIKPDTVTRKQGASRLSETVPNYAQLKASFQGSEWAAFFDES